ncbi:hypothetical protein [Rubellimicrobium mesophilum]|nr:hypothetical protein [Rubellimicrobium mesophilum]
MKRFLPLLALLPFAACEAPEAGLDRPAPTETAPVAVTATPVARVTPVAVPVVAPPVATAPIVAAPAAPPGGVLAPPPVAEGIAIGEPNPAAPTPVSATPSGVLGNTVASLGSTEPGRWLETPLVTAPTQGRVEYNGEIVDVELRPSGGEPGSGSQISLEAMRALGAPLTGLPELTVYGS